MAYTCNFIDFAGDHSESKQILDFPGGKEI